MFFDTHVLVWMLGERHRLSAAARAAMSDPDQPWFISAVVAWDFSDLATRGRLGPIGTLSDVLDRFELGILPFPPMLGNCRQLCLHIIAIRPIVCSSPMHFLKT